MTACGSSAGRPWAEQQIQASSHYETTESEAAQGEAASVHGLSIAAPDGWYVASDVGRGGTWNYKVAISAA
jgi:hypothetical protein